jgi:hypothetical protein
MKFMQVVFLAFTISALPAARMSKKFAVVDEGDATINANVNEVANNLSPVGDAVAESRVVGVPIAADAQDSELLNESEFL